MPYWDPIGLSGSHPGPRDSVSSWILVVGCVRGCRYGRNVQRQHRIVARNPGRNETVIVCSIL